MSDKSLIDDCRDRIDQQRVGEWMQVTQDMVNLFADATHDHQWIHTDPERATKESPFGGPVAHGFLTLSMVPVLMGAQDEHEPFLPPAKLIVNYGLNKVRFPAAVPVDARIRGVSVIKQVEEIAGGAQVIAQCSVEIDGGEKPACVAEVVFRLFS